MDAMLAADVTGGDGSVPDAVLAGLPVGVTAGLGADDLSGSDKDIYAFILLIVVPMVRPAGVFGILAKTKA